MKTIYLINLNTIKKKNINFTARSDILFYFILFTAQPIYNILTLEIKSSTLNVLAPQ